MKKQVLAPASPVADARSKTATQRVPYAQTHVANFPRKSCGTLLMYDSWVLNWLCLTDDTVFTMNCIDDGRRDCIHLYLRAWFFWFPSNKSHETNDLNAGSRRLQAKLPYDETVPSWPNSWSETQTWPKFCQKQTTHLSFVVIVSARFVYWQNDL